MGPVVPMGRLWRFVADDGATAAGGLATDEALMAAYRRGEPEHAPTLRLYTYADHAALCGRFQNLEAEIDLAACAGTSTGYSRRPTGGGAIIMGRDQLGVAVVDRARPERPKETLRRLSEGIVAGLASLGIDASFRGKNDLEVGGRKIAGLGLYLDDDGALLFHASILVGLDIPFMLRVLRIPAAKLGGKGAAAVGRRVTTVSEQTGEEWTGAVLRDVVARGFEEALGVRLVLSPPDDAERKAAAALEIARYRDRGWLFQRSPGAQAQGVATFKTPGGLVRVYLALDNGVVQSALFTGDFNSLPDELVRLEATLKWTRLDPERITRVVEAVFAGANPLDVSAAEIAAALVEAGGRAARRSASHPRREGSCYFPEVS